MKLFKIILILILLFSISFGVSGEFDTLEIEISERMPPFFIDDPNPETLLEWFSDLSLDEKVEIYNWWKLESVKLKIISEYPFGELFIRLDKEGD